MDFMEWSKLPELGIEEIDKEHREILELMSTLRNTLRAGQVGATSRALLSNILEEGISFIRDHFVTEENLMQISLYPKFLEHKKEHELFLERLLSLQEKAKTGSQPLTVETLNVMGNWLHHHVLEVDKPLVPHLLRTAFTSGCRRLE